MRVKTNEIRNIKCGNMHIQISNYNEYYDKVIIKVGGKEKMNNKKRKKEGLSFLEWLEKDNKGVKTAFVRYLKYLEKNNYNYNNLN